MLGELLLLGFLGALVLLTRHEIGPFLIHRPIIATPLLGACVGLADTGFFLGACLEWVWIDRIPAGGIRTPAVSAGAFAGLVALVTLEFSGLVAGNARAFLPFALLIAAIYTLLYVPLDGGLRRLWNLASEGVVAALDRGSMAELRAYGASALLVRWVLTALGLLSAAGATHAAVLWFDDLEAFQVSTAWPWVIPAGIAGFVLRRARRREQIMAVIAFTIGIGVACLV